MAFGAAWVCGRTPPSAFGAAVDWRQDHSAVRVHDAMIMRFDGVVGDLTERREAVGKGKEVEGDDGYTDDESDHGDGD